MTAAEVRCACGRPGFTVCPPCQLRAIDTLAAERTREETAYAERVLAAHGQLAGAGPDPWHPQRWAALPMRCLIGNCSAGPEDMDPRGPVKLADGTWHRACRPHWEGIMSVVGRQVTERQWEDGDTAARMGPGVPDVVVEVPGLLGDRERASIAREAARTNGGRRGRG